MKIPRKQFVENYAQRSGIESRFSSLGFLDCDGETLIALPCECESALCEGWAMVSPSAVDTHLRMYAPEPLKSVYSDAIKTPSPE